MLVQVMILDKKYNDAINELESIESIQYKPGTISTLIGLTKMQYGNRNTNEANERKKERQIADILGACLKYYQDNSSAKKDNEEFVFRVQLDYCDRLISLEQYKEAYDICNELLNSNYLSNDQRKKVNGIFMLCAINCNDISKAEAISKNFEIKIDNNNNNNDAASLVSKIPQPNLDEMKLEDKLDFNRTLDEITGKKRGKKGANQNKNNDVVTTRKQNQNQNQNSRKQQQRQGGKKQKQKGKKKEKGSGSGSMSHGASQGFVGSLDRYRIKDPSELSNFIFLFVFWDVV